MFNLLHALACELYLNCVALNLLVSLINLSKFYLVLFLVDDFQELCLYFVIVEENWVSNQGAGVGSS